MTQEDIRLLITDLAGRVPYGVFVQKTEDGEFGRLISVQIPSYCVVHIEKSCWSFDEYDLSKQTVKPFLRPLSSMTAEEWEEYGELENAISDYDVDTRHAAGTIADWMNEKHLDYRGLIDKGLALEALEGMYKANGPDYVRMAMHNCRACELYYKKECCPESGVFKCETGTDKSEEI